ncbi:MAG: glycosyltransferase family 4 protein [Nitrososphaerota archaeon]|nr:glycosyltransferase family 4 protein [Nitrososphaerota archaeon]
MVILQFTNLKLSIISINNSQGVFNNKGLNSIKQPINRVNPLRILMITPFYNPNIGGVETHLDDLCIYLASKGCIIDVLTYQPLNTKKKGKSLEIKGKIFIRRINWFGKGLFDKFESKPILEFIYLFPALSLCTYIFILSHKNDFDILYTHGLIGSLIGVFARILANKPAVSSIHTIYNLDKHQILSKILVWIFGGYNSILFASKLMQKEFTKIGINQKKTKIFTYWANEKLFKPIPKEVAKKTLKWDDKFVVLFVGRLIKNKGIDVLIDIAKRSNNNIFYAIVTNANLDEFRRYINDDLPKNIIYVGPVEYSKLNNYYAAADIFILPSQHREGFSRAIIEASLCGTPVLASKVGNLPEEVNTKMGELVDPPTAISFLDKINYYYLNKAKLHSLSETCAKYAHSYFTSKNAKYIYNTLLDLM